MVRTCSYSLPWNARSRPAAAECARQCNLYPAIFLQVPDGRDFVLFGCIYLPDFPVQAALRSHAVSFLSTPVAVLDGPESLLKVVACNNPAREAGVVVGMTKILAESCFAVVLRRRAVEQEEAAQSALLECAQRFSPRLESTVPGTVILNLTGADRLLGSPQEIGQALLFRAEVSGFTANVAIAANPDTALYAARGYKGLSVVAPGEEAACLARLTTQVLDPPEEILETFDHWGIRTLHSLAVLPQVPLTERLGQQGLHLQRLAKGKVERELMPAEAPPAFVESMALEEPVELLEPLTFILHRLLEQLMRQLCERSLATDHLQLDLVLEIHLDRDLHTDPLPLAGTSQYQRSLKLPAPSQDVKVLLKLLQLDLAAHPPEAPVKKITIEAFPAHLRPTQTGLFQPLAPEPAKLEITMARLRAVVGREDNQGRSRVGFPEILDSHRPDSFAVWPVGVEQVSKHDTQSLSHIALRLFRPALAARVELREGRPAVVAFKHNWAKVLRAAGPWRSTGSWWGGEWQRDEWDLYLSMDNAATLYRFFHDLLSCQWFVEGMYD